jgi:hypothetical protein
MVLPIKLAVVLPVRDGHSGPNETGEKLQEAKRHRASSEPARSEDLAGDVAAMARETKSLASRCGSLAASDYFLEFAWTSAEGCAPLKWN